MRYSHLLIENDESNSDDYKTATMTRFNNELNNEIIVDVTLQDITGVPGVMIYISGPNSSTENHITVMEAQIIYDKLGELLKQQ